MPSLHRHKTSPFWYCSYRKPDGSWALRSTKEKKRSKAEEICFTWAKATREAVKGKLTEAAARKAIGEIYALTHDDQLPTATAKAFIDDWLQKKDVETKPGTSRKYRDVLTQFLTSIGELQHQDISRLTTKHVSHFRDQLFKRLSVGSTNIAVKIVRVALAQAKREGYISENPAENVAAIKSQEEAIERRPFTLDELKRIVEAADEEWKGMILFGLYTGQRLKDIAELTWKNLDLQRQELRLVTGKTSRRQILPLAAPLVTLVEKMSAGDDPGAPLFPRAYKTIEETDRSGSLSNQFYEILRSAGLAPKRTHVKAESGKGRSSRRKTNELSFHSLRHTATSLMKNAGISSAIVQEFIGHDSAAVSANYTHIEMASLRKAAESMPDVLK